MEEFRIREKGKGHFVVQKKIAGVWATRTLSPGKIWEMLEVSDKKETKVSETTEKINPNTEQSFAQVLLSEPSKEEDLQTQIREAQDKILNELFKAEKKS